MELGEKILAARLEAGLSQRQLCGDVITRNMLSRIEHGAAKPSMNTLRYLAGVLDKPMGYFLGEVEDSPNERVMLAAREEFLMGKYPMALRTLENYQGPDPRYDWEEGLLGYLSCLMAAANAQREGREPVKEKFLKQSARFDSPYIVGPIQGLQETLSGQPRVGSLDEQLLRQAEYALDKKNPQRAEALLEAVENRTPAWYFLRGSAAMEQKDYETAQRCLEQGEEKQCLPLLEECYKAQGNFEKAYFCACRRREG